ncbi:MAG: ABC transporter ATP-binding protein [Thermoplasmata archaeon]|nr:ABC transporter ATP-binding protein [Thermoplasmata archaeon]
MAESEDNSNTIVSKGITVSYGPILALDNFSVEVPSGIVGLLGPNGAGKSTFIKAILGLLTPDKGQIKIAGHNPFTESAIVRDMVGYMPEHDCLIDNFTAIDLVSYLGQISGMKKRDAMPRSHEMLDFVGIGEERYRLISSYSTGMKQRVKLAQAIVHDPNILFLDEPTNGMDPHGREDMLALIKKISDSDKTILVSTHILDDIEKVSDHAMIISNGRLITQGNLDELLEGKENLKIVKIRGPEPAMKDFAKVLEDSYEVRSVILESGQTTIQFINTDGGNDLFKLSREKNVQLRAYYPERATLEDVFIGTLEQQNGGAENGN